MTDLIARLNAAMDEEERIAKLACSGGKGEWASDWPEIRNDIGIPVTRHTWATEGSHIIRHSPAAVLRKVEGARKILELHKLADYGSPWESNCDRCGTSSEYPVDWPCDTVEALAGMFGVEVNE